MLRCVPLKRLQHISKDAKNVFEWNLEEILGEVYSAWGNGLASSTGHAHQFEGHDVYVCDDLLCSL